MKQDSDWELFEAWKAGDSKAGQRFYDRYFGQLRRFFINKAVADDADDLIQETLMGCLVAEYRGERGASFRTFVFRIGYYKLMDQLRRKRRMREKLELEEMSVEEIDPGPGPWTRLGTRREQKMLVCALRRIPIDYQVVLELHYWEHMSAPEIGEILEHPEATIRRRMQLGRERLEKQLEMLAANPDELGSTIANLDQWAAQVREQLCRSESEPDEEP